MGTMKSAMREKSKATIVFRATLAPDGERATKKSWVLTLPKSASAALPSRGEITVEGMIGCFPFRAALDADGKGGHSLAVNEIMRDAACADDDDAVTVEITRAGDEPELRVPTDLRKALADDEVSKAGWDDITPMARRDWIFSITSAKQPETRARRIAKAVDMLSCGKRRLCCFPGVKWMMKENEKSCGMWLPLPAAEKPRTIKPARPSRSRK